MSQADNKLRLRITDALKPFIIEALTERPNDVAVVGMADPRMYWTSKERGSYREIDITLRVIEHLNDEPYDETQYDGTP